MSLVQCPYKDKCSFKQCYHRKPHELEGICKGFCKEYGEYVKCKQVIWKKRDDK